MLKNDNCQHFDTIFERNTHKKEKYCRKFNKRIFGSIGGTAQI